MSDFDRLLEIAGSQDVIEGVNLPKVLLHKWLVLGQTEYLCEHGTLSDGHEKFTPAQKYSQSLKEQYYLALNMANQKAIGMEAQADILDAEEDLSKATSESQKLRAKAKLEKAKAQLVSALTIVEDQSRMLKFYRRKAASLKEVVEAQYPKGIEQAESDNWTEVFHYRMKKGGGIGMGERVDNIPLDSYRKAALGIQYQRPDATAPLEIAEKNKIPSTASLKEYLDFAKQQGWICQSGDKELVES